MSVKKIVFKRDKGKCVLCGNTYNGMPNSHYVRRSYGGLGIEQNIFTAFTNLTDNKCHELWDKYKCTDEEVDKVTNYFKNIYDNWNKKDLYYKK